MKHILLLLLLFVMVQLAALAQCFDFAKEVTKTKLPPYIHDGNYNTTMLTEGQEAEFFKTFYAGQKYRIVVSSDEKLEVPEFEILDKTRKVLYNNKDNNDSENWDFTLEKSQQLIISIKVPQKDETAGTPKRGCVSIVFGFLNQG